MRPPRFHPTHRWSGHHQGHRNPGRNSSGHSSRGCPTSNRGQPQLELQATGRRWINPGPIPRPAAARPDRGLCGRRLLPGGAGHLRVEQRRGDTGEYAVAWEIGGATYRQLAETQPDLGDPPVPLSSGSLVVHKVGDGTPVILGSRSSYVEPTTGNGTGCERAPAPGVLGRAQASTVVSKRVAPVRQACLLGVSSVRNGPLP